MAGNEVQLRLREDAWPEARAAFLRRLWRPVALAPVALGLAYLSISIVNPEAGALDLSSFGATAVLMAALLPVGFALAYRKERKAWRDFLLTVSEVHLRRTLPGFLPVEIARGEVALLEDHAAGLIVRSRSGVALLVPRQLERFDEVRTHLEGWHSIVPAKAVPAPRRLLGWAIAIAWVVGFFVLEIRIARTGWRNALLETAVLAGMGAALLAWARRQIALPIAVRRRFMLYGLAAMLLPLLHAGLAWLMERLASTPGGP
jgi:hypothetical protein